MKDRGRDPRYAALVTDHVILKSKLQLGGENVVRKLIKKEAISSVVLPTEINFFLTQKNNITDPFFQQEEKRKLSDTSEL